MPRKAKPSFDADVVNEAIKGACASLVNSIGKSWVTKSCMAFLNELRASGHLSESVYEELKARQRDGKLV